jgi:steroid delta-isomerase-like uncharacterized protein
LWTVEPVGGRHGLSRSPATGAPDGRYWQPNALIANGDATSKGAEMNTKELKTLNERFLDEVFRNRNVDAIDDMLTDDFVEHILFPGQAEGRQGTKEFIGQMLDAFPDLEFQVENEIAEGDMVASEMVMTGTHQAEFVGIPPTGRKISVHFMDMARVRGGQFSEHWGLADTGSLMAQLGVTPPAGR